MVNVEAPLGSWTQKPFVRHEASSRLESMLPTGTMSKAAAGEQPESDTHKAPASDLK